MVRKLHIFKLCEQKRRGFCRFVCHSERSEESEYIHKAIL